MFFTVMQTGSWLFSGGKENVLSINVPSFLKWWNKQQTFAVGCVIFKSSFFLHYSSLLCQLWPCTGGLVCPGGYGHKSQCENFKQRL